MIIFGSNDLGKVRSLVVWSVDSYKVTSPIYRILYYIFNSISELTPEVIIVRQCKKRVDTAGYSKLSIEIKEYVDRKLTCSISFLNFVEYGIYLKGGTNLDYDIINFYSMTVECRDGRRNDTGNYTVILKRNSVSLYLINEYRD